MKHGAKLLLELLEIGRIGCDLAFLLIGHPVDFGLRRFGVNEAINTQTAL
jgi:hypothetical protein